jgi:hypothetical protein
MTDTPDYARIQVPPTAVINGRASFAQVYDVTMIVSNVPKWSDAEVLQYLEEMAVVGGGISVPASIAIFLGAVFDAGQRKIATEWTAARGYTPAKRLTMISDSALIRGAMTAYSWLNKTDAKAFPMKDADAMCQWICQDRIAQPDAVKIALTGCFQAIGKTLP